MMHGLHPVISLALLLGMVCSFAWILGETMRRLNARGTRGRWYWAGVERAFRWPAGIYLGMSAAVWFQYDQHLYFLVDCLGVALWITVLLEKKGENDDDFWPKVGEKLRSMLSPNTAHGTA